MLVPLKFRGVARIAVSKELPPLRCLRACTRGISAEPTSWLSRWPADVDWKVSSSPASSDSPRLSQPTSSSMAARDSPGGAHSSSKGR